MSPDFEPDTGTFDYAPSSCLPSFNLVWFPNEGLGDPSSSLLVVRKMWWTSYSSWAAPPSRLMSDRGHYDAYSSNMLWVIHLRWNRRLNFHIVLSLELLAIFLPFTFRISIGLRSPDRNGFRHFETTILWISFFLLLFLVPWQGSLISSTSPLIVLACHHFLVAGNLARCRDCFIFSTTFWNIWPPLRPLGGWCFYPPSWKSLFFFGPLIDRGGLLGLV